jgi:hypothetical protein
VIAKVVCAWCGYICGEKDIDIPIELTMEPTTHGICPQCAERLMKLMTDVATKEEESDSPGRSSEHPLGMICTIKDSLE